MLVCLVTGFSVVAAVHSNVVEAGILDVTLIPNHKIMRGAHGLKRVSTDNNDKNTPHNTKIPLQRDKIFQNTN